jgi:hypothetical protein
MIIQYKVNHFPQTPFWKWFFANDCGSIFLPDIYDAWWENPGPHFALTDRINTIERLLLMGLITLEEAKILLAPAPCHE